MNALYAADSWVTADMVTDRLREAWDTLRRVPAQRVPGHRTMWPEIVRDYYEAYGTEAPRVRLPPAAPRAIDRMHECFGWFVHLEGEPDMAKAMWLTLGARLSSKTAGRILGVSRWTVRSRRNEAVKRIVEAIHRKAA